MEVYSIDMDSRSVAFRSSSYERKIPGDLRKKIAIGEELNKADFDQLPKQLLVKEVVGEADPSVYRAAGPVWIVSQAFADVLEALELSVHTLIPVTVSVVPGNRSLMGYWLFVGNAVDAFDYERTEWARGVSGYEAARDVRFIIDGATTFQREKITGLHLWRGTEGAPVKPPYYCSEALKSALFERGLHGLKFERCFLS